MHSNDNYENKKQPKRGAGNKRINIIRAVRMKWQQLLHSVVAYRRGYPIRILALELKLKLAIRLRALPGNNTKKLWPTTTQRRSERNFGKQKRKTTENLNKANCEHSWGFKRLFISPREWELRMPRMGEGLYADLKPKPSLNRMCERARLTEQRNDEVRRKVATIELLQLYNFEFIYSIVIFIPQFTSFAAYLQVEESQLKLSPSALSLLPSLSSPLLT